MEEIRDYSNNILAILIRKNFEKDGINFFTPNSYSQQLGAMKHKKGHIIKRHTHKYNERLVVQTQEVLIIKKGVLKVDFYDVKLNYFDSKILNEGDLILLASGGHGFEVIEDLEMFEIKQGPYDEDKDKELF
tara:strand:- start:226 stop:621 length:396 start_codon:yes stop_codon:yes gene_type:complete